MVMEFMIGNTKFEAQFLNQIANPSLVDDLLGNNPATEQTISVHIIELMNLSTWAVDLVKPGCQLSVRA
jgi:hypothetical protein